MTTLAADPSLSDLFRIPEQTWTTVSKRVEWDVSLRPVALYWDESIPGFSDYIGACEAWALKIFPEAAALANSLVPFAEKAVSKLARLEEHFKSLPPGPVPNPDLSGTVAAHLGSLPAETRRFEARSEALDADIASFVAANRAADARLEAYQRGIGATWKRLEEEVQAVERAGGSVRGAWRALADDIDDITKVRQAQTTGIEVRLGLARAANSWRDLGAEAAAFASRAGVQSILLASAAARPEDVTGPERELRVRLRADVALVLSTIDR